MLLIDSLFLLCPMADLPLLDKSARLDMLDYYEAQMEARGTNILGGTSVLTEKTNSTLTIRMTDVSTWHMEILPAEQIKKKKRPAGIPVRTTHVVSVPGLPDRTKTKVIYL